MHGGTLDGLRHKRGRRHLDFAACDVGRGATNADRGYDASALTRLRVDFASAPHRDTLLDRKAIGRPAKIGLRCHCPDQGGTSCARRGIFFDAQSGGSEILVDAHTGGGGSPVTVSNGLFSVQLGGGTVTDGSG